MDKVRVAMIGAGWMAQTGHYPSLASFEDVEFAGICELDPERLSRTADKYGIEKRYSNYRQMVEETAPDAVYAIGNPDVMYDVWMWCLGQGLNLYIEKPMGITLHQARALAYMAEKKGCVTQVGFQRRVCPLLVTLRQECLQHGPINHAVCEFYKCAREPYLMARDHMMDDAVHAIDTVRWLCGGEVVEIQSRVGRVETPDINLITALLHFDTGATGAILCHWASGRRVFRVEMHAPGVCAEADPEGQGALYANGDTKGVAYETREVSGGDEFYIFAGFQAKNRDFIDAVKSHGRSSSHFGDAVKTMEVAEKILAASLLKGQ